MESAWSNGKPACRCRHGHTSATPPDSHRPKNAYVREDRVLEQLTALHLLLTGAQPTGKRTRRRTRRGTDARPTVSPEEATGYLRGRGITITWARPRAPCRRVPRPSPRPSPGKQANPGPKAPHLREDTGIAGRPALAPA
jgi:hypothetical protein